MRFLKCGFTQRLGRWVPTLLLTVIVSWCHAQSVTTLHDFAGLEGAYPVSALIEGTDGNLYGTTFDGGDNFAGTIYSVSPDGLTYSTIYSFTGGDDGAFPYGGLVQDSSSALYGVAPFGGSKEVGTVYKLDPITGFSVLHTFNGTSGGNPYGTLVLGTDGYLYGTTATGGNAGSGEIFKIKTDGTYFKIIHGFHQLATTGVFANADGSRPQAGLVFGSDGNLYGSATLGGEFGRGTLFSLATDGSNFTVLHSFDAFNSSSPHTNTDGFDTLMSLFRASDGNLYGTAVYGGSGFGGTIYRLNTATDGSFEVLYTFTGPDGAQPLGTLAEGNDGLLYGTTQSGGETGTGTIYSLDPSSLDFTLLYTSRPHTNGINYAGFNFSGMILGSNGLFYGTANLGGGFGYGTVFSFDPLAPPITRIDHPSAPAGSKSKTIIVFGTGFTAGAFVQFNGVALSSSPISSTEVRAVIPASDLTTPGTAQITVNQNGHISNPLTYTIE